MTATLIQILLLLAVAVLVWYFVANRRKARTKAGVKLGFLVFVVACVWAVLRPDDLTVIANAVGVDRGTDLLLYALVVLFFSGTVTAYRRDAANEKKLTRLARALALSNVRVKTEDDANLGK